MTPTHASRRVIADRLSLIDDLLADIRGLPLAHKDAFLANRYNVWAAESCLRRSLEALFDIGRHILAKAFGKGVTEYKETALRLRDEGVLLPDEGAIARTLAGYRNRMVHFYDEVSPEELYEICAFRLSDIETVQSALKRWAKDNLKEQ